MQQESFTADDTLSGIVQPLSDPLPAKESAPFEAVLGYVSKIIDVSRESAARSVNAALTAAYWFTGHRITEFEQSGKERAEYGAALIDGLAEDLTLQFGRGFSRQNLQHMRLFYIACPSDRILQAPSGKLALPPERQIRQTPSSISESPPSRWHSTTFSTAFPLPRYT